MRGDDLDVPAVDVQQRLVAHVEGAHELQRRYLEREVEGRDDSHGPEGEAVAVALLPCVVPRHSEGAGQEAYLHRQAYSKV